jgi:hypothetical protein
MILFSYNRSRKIGKLWRFACLAALLVMMDSFVSCAVYAATDAPKTDASPMQLSQLVDNLIAKNEERARGLKGYEGQRIYTVVYHGFPKDMDARIVVSMQYASPDSKEFTILSESGPKLLVDKVLKRLLKTETDAQQQKTRVAVNLDRQNYVFSNLEYARAADGCSYVLTVEPKKSNKYLYRGKIRINEQDFAVCGIQAQPAENPSFWITSTVIDEGYEKIGEFWLPENNTSVSKLRFGGSATLTIQYRDYKVQARQLASTPALSSSTLVGK